MNGDVFGVLLGAVDGLAVWWFFILPFQNNELERRRREMGLPPKRKLPEDP